MNLKHRLPLRKAIGLGMALVTPSHCGCVLNRRASGLNAAPTIRWSAKTVGRYARTARECAVDFHEYLITSQNIDLASANEITAEIDRSLKSAALQLKRMTADHRVDVVETDQVTTAEKEVAAASQQLLRIKCCHLAMPAARQQIAAGYSQIAAHLDAALWRLNELHRMLAERDYRIDASQDGDRDVAKGRSAPTAPWERTTTVDLAI